MSRLQAPYRRIPSDTLLDLLLPRLAIAGALGVLREHRRCPGCVACGGARRFLQANARRGR
jgi:hypothetical protein